MSAPMTVTGTVTDGVNTWDVTGTLRPTAPPPPPVVPRPVEVPSFGPNGTHWPADTPWPTDPIAHVIDVACTWPDIAAALASVSQQQADEGMWVRIAPGTLAGQGGGGGGTPVLDQLGSLTWGTKVLVSPRDGYGTVTLTGPTKFRQVNGITFAGLDADSNITLQACTGSRLAWSTTAGWLVYGLANPGLATEDCDLYEVVVDDPIVLSQDPTGFGSGYITAHDGSLTGVLRNCSLVGCYTAPHFRKQGDSAHIDTCQQFGKAPYYGIVYRDTVLFGSTNCALQTGGTGAAAKQGSIPADATELFRLEHTMLVGGRSAAARYPTSSGGDTSALNQATNGGPLGLLPGVAHDSVMVGTVFTPSNWADVQNTTIPAARSGITAALGGFTVDPTLQAPDAAWFDQQAPRPTRDRLAQLWAPLAG